MGHIQSTALRNASTQLSRAHEAPSHLSRIDQQDGNLCLSIFTQPGREQQRNNIGESVRLIFNPQARVSLARDLRGSMAAECGAVAGTEICLRLH
jgi:hypothetical protein